jgi:predicted  nucleic acid-binding Zn-ribbon protein
MEDMTFLIEQHSKEVWALKEQISNQSKELTVLQGTKQVVVKLSNELVNMKKRALAAEEKVKELEEEIKC